MLKDPQKPEERRRPPQPERMRHPLEEPFQPPPPPERDDEEEATTQVRLQINVVRPYATYILLAINLAIFAVGFVASDVGRQLFQFGASRAYEVLVLGEYHRLFTAMFLHASVAHIFFNMYALYIIGRQIEPVFGTSRFAIIYLLGGLAGSILSVILGNPDPLQGVPSVGASGAVFAIFGAEMIYLYRHRQLMGRRGSRQLQSLVMLLGLNLFIGIASWFGNSGIRIDNWAHMGGLVGGLILTWLIGPIFAVTLDPTDANRHIAEDTNPVEGRYWLVSIYLIAVVGVLAVFSFLVR